MNNGDKYAQQDFERIERYLMGEMDPAERADFEQELSGNTDLQTALEHTRLLVKGIEYAGMKGMMDDFHSNIPDHSNETEFTQTTLKTIKSRVIPYLVAASILLLVVFGAWWLTNLQPAHEKLFARHFQPDPGLITPMSGGADYQFYSGMVDYKSENYENAIEKWNRVLEQKPLNDTLSFFMGVAHLANNDIENALYNLQQAITFDQSEFLDDAWYYLGLTYLKKGKKDDALKAMKESGHDNAAAVVRDMEQLKN